MQPPFRPSCPQGFDGVQPRDMGGHVKGWGGKGYGSGGKSKDKGKVDKGGKGKYMGDKGGKGKDEGGKRSKSQEKGALLAPMPDDQVLSCRWVCGTAAYPAKGEENSWWSIVEIVKFELNHNIKLSGRARQERLVLRGPRVCEMFDIVVQMTRAAGISLAGAGMPRLASGDVVWTVQDDHGDDDVDDEGPEEDAQEETKEERASMQSEDEEVIWGDVTEDADEVVEEAGEQADEDVEEAEEQADEDVEEGDFQARRAGVRRAAELPSAVPASEATHLERLFSLAESVAGKQMQETTRMEILHAKHVTNLGSVKRLPLDIGFATTCLGRGFQLAPQLVINMALAAPYRQDMTFYVVLFRGATEDNLRF